MCKQHISRSVNLHDGLDMLCGCGKLNVNVCILARACGGTSSLACLGATCVDTLSWQLPQSIVVACMAVLQVRLPMLSYGLIFELNLVMLYTTCGVSVPCACRWDE